METKEYVCMFVILVIIFLFTYDYFNNINNKNIQNLMLVTVLGAIQYFFKFNIHFPRGKIGQLSDIC